MSEFRSGFVAILGRPNVGKSSIMNYFIGEKVAIVSNHPQTTRSKLLGVLSALCQGSLKNTYRGRIILLIRPVVLLPLPYFIGHALYPPRIHLRQIIVGFDPAHPA